MTGARRIYVEICENAPDDAEAWLMLGLIDSECGDNQAALSALRQAISHDPGLAEAHFNLASLLLDSGQVDESIAACRRAVEADPEYTEAWLLLGTMHARSACFELAADCFRRTLALDPDNLDAAVNMGRVLVSGGYRQAAVEHCTRALQAHPNNATLWVSLGDVYCELGYNKKAAEAFEHVIRLEPGNQRVLPSLAGLYLEQGQVVQANRICQELLAANPRHLAALSLMGAVQQLQGNLRQAADFYDRAVGLDPASTSSHYRLACICQSLGELDRALSHFKRVLELDPKHAPALGGLVRVYDQRNDRVKVEQLLPRLAAAASCNPLVLPTMAVVSPGSGMEDTCLEELQRALRDNVLPVAVRSRLYWAAATLYERKKDYDTAFTHYSQAKALGQARYDAAAHSRFIDRIIRTFSRAMLDTIPAVSVHTQSPVFIVGMPRSGTSLIEQILASHSNIYGAGELDTLSRLARDLSGAGRRGDRYPECMQGLDQASLDVAAATYLADLPGPARDFPRVTDKMPHNFLYLGLVQLLFPDARIIHVARDPLDTCLSCFFQEFSNAHAYTRSLTDLGAHYTDYLRIMDHWRRVLAVPMLRVQYETLIDEPERTMHTLIEFCGLAWDPACAEFYKADRVVATLSSAQVREPLNRNSIGRWRHYEKHLTPLINSLAAS